MQTITLGGNRNWKNAEFISGIGHDGHSQYVSRDGYHLPDYDSSDAGEGEYYLCGLEDTVCKAESLGLWYYDDETGIFETLDGKTICPECQRVFVERRPDRKQDEVPSRRRFEGRMRKKKEHCSVLGCQEVAEWTVQRDCGPDEDMVCDSRLACTAHAIMAMLENRNACRLIRVGHEDCYA